MRLIWIPLLLVLLGAAGWWLRSRVAGAGARAADEDAERLYQQGMDCRRGLGVEVDFPRARELLLQCAEKGHVAAQFDLGMLLRQGLGGAQDVPQGMRWIEQAAESGETRAQICLGKCALVGDGIEQNVQSAEYWLLSAAQAGSAEAQTALGALYRDKSSLLRNPLKAVEWTKRAAEQNHAPAMYALSEMFEHGEGVMRDVHAADEWLLKAAEHGVPEAEYKLARFYLSGAYGHQFPQDYRKALHWFKWAGAHGVAEAEYEQALLYERNEGVDEPDPTRVAECMLKSAQMGYAAAQYRMGQMFAYGDKVGQNLAEARRWFAAAAAQGYQDAAEQEMKLRGRLGEQAFMASVEPASTSREVKGPDWEG